MITLQELCGYLDELLQVSQFEDYCFNGLQVEGGHTVKKMATAVTASLETIEAAVACGAQALLVHHGLFWNRDSHQISGVKKKKLACLLKHEISLLNYHLPLDAHQELGNNWKAAKEMGWKCLESFYYVKGIPFGVKGVVKKTSREEFQKQLEEYYQHSAHCAMGGKETVETVGLISGGAHRQVADAAAEGLDCFVTGSFDEPVWHVAREEHINFFAMGHSATETVGPKALGEHLAERFGLSHQFLEISNPF